MRKWKVGILTPELKFLEFYNVLKDHSCDLILGKYWEEYQDYKYRDEELIQLFGQCDGIIVGGRDNVTRVFMEHAPNLVVISKSSIGVDNIDVESATELSIVVTNAPDNYLSIAEGTVALMLAVLKKIVKMDQRTRLGKWRDFGDLPIMLNGKSVGLIGFGRVGRAVAQRLQGWGVDILVYDPYVEADTIVSFGGSPSSLDKLLRTSDIISLHLVLNKETYHFLNRERLKLLKEDSIIINTSRGAFIDEKELYQILKTKKIYGAGLDVYEKEPPSPINPLLKLDNVVVTPHGLSITDDGRKMLISIATMDCLQAIQGHEPKNIKNFEVLQKWKQRRFD